MARICPKCGEGLLTKGTTFDIATGGRRPLTWCLECGWELGVNAGGSD